MFKHREQLRKRARKAEARMLLMVQQHNMGSPNIAPHIVNARATVLRRYCRLVITLAREAKAPEVRASAFNAIMHIHISVSPIRRKNSAALY